MHGVSMDNHNNINKIKKYTTKYICALFPKVPHPLPKKLFQTCRFSKVRKQIQEEVQASGF